MARILVRNVFQAKYGRGDELVALFNESGEQGPPRADTNLRILTDASGPFFTVVTELEMESLAAWEQWTREVFGNPEFGDWFSRMVELVESGHREFYNIET